MARKTPFFVYIYAFHFITSMYRTGMSGHFRPACRTGSPALVELESQSNSSGQFPVSTKDRMFFVRPDISRPGIPASSLREPGQFPVSTKKQNVFLYDYSPACFIPRMESSRSFNPTPRSMRRLPLIASMELMPMPPIISFISRVHAMTRFSRR